MSKSNRVSTNRHTSSVDGKTKEKICIKYDIYLRAMNLLDDDKMSSAQLKQLLIELNVVDPNTQQYEVAIQSLIDNEILKKTRIGESNRVMLLFKKYAKRYLAGVDSSQKIRAVCDDATELSKMRSIVKIEYILTLVIPYVKSVYGQVTIDNIKLFLDSKCNSLLYNEKTIDKYYDLLLVDHFIADRVKAMQLRDLYIKSRNKINLNKNLTTEEQEAVDCHNYFLKDNGHGYDYPNQIWSAYKGVVQFSKADTAPISTFLQLQKRDLFIQSIKYNEDTNRFRVKFIVLEAYDKADRSKYIKLIESFMSTFNYLTDNTSNDFEVVIYLQSATLKDTLRKSLLLKVPHAIRKKSSILAIEQINDFREYILDTNSNKSSTIKIRVESNTVRKKYVNNRDE